MQDASSTTCSPAEHYLTQGWEKGYNPSPHFSTNEYLKTYPDVAAAGVNPLLHYINSGKKEGRKAFPVENNKIAERNASKWGLWRLASRIWGRIKYRKEIKANSNGKILVYLHCADISAWRIACSYFGNLQPYHCDYIISYQDDALTNKIQSWIPCNGKKLAVKKESKGTHTFISFIRCLSDIDLSSYQIAIRIETTLRTNAAQKLFGNIYIGSEWNKMICEGLLGVTHVHKMIQMLSRDGAVGCITAEELLVTPSSEQKTELNNMAKELRLPVMNYPLFAAGCTFAMRCDLLKKFYKTINRASVNTEINASALEILMTAFIEKRGYIIEGIPTGHPPRYVERVFHHVK